jgi:lysophospholipase L1-like esterase
MGAWFVMSAMGLFQMDGGASVKPIYEIGSPLFRKVTIKLDDRYYPGGKFVIEARNNSGENRYIQKATLNGKTWNKPWFYHEELVNGGKLVLEMGPEPNEKWGSDPEDAPPSLSTVLTEEEEEEILHYDRLAVEMEAWNRAVKAYYYHRKEQFEMMSDTKDEIIMLGNSLTDQAEWNEILNNPHVKNRGIGGDDTDGVLERLNGIVAVEPAKVFILIGTNDLAYGKGVDQVIENYRRILDTLAMQTPETRVYVQSILPTEDAIHTTRPNGDIMKINARLREICRERGVAYIDLFTAFATEDHKLNPEYSIDGLHLNGKGYMLWKDLIEKYVKE